jgi:cyclase
MLKTRVIPGLLLANNRIVKTVKFKNPTYIGDPVNTLRIFNRKEVDEILILDILATSTGKGPNYELLAEMASEAFMPLAYGGGIASIESMEKIFSLGFEKVVLNTAALHNPQLLIDAIKQFGSQSIVVCIDLKKSFLGTFKPHFDNGKQAATVNLNEYLSYLSESKVGEIIINNIDRDGTMEGYDLKLIRDVSALVDAPLVAMGGAGHLNHFKEAKLAGADALGAGSIFVYHGKKKGILLTYPHYDDLKNLLDS